MSCTQHLQAHRTQSCSLPPSLPTRAEPHCEPVAPGICLQHMSLPAPMCRGRGGRNRWEDQTADTCFHYAQIFCLTLRCSGHSTCFHHAQKHLLVLGSPPQTQANRCSLQTSIYPAASPSPCHDCGCDCWSARTWAPSAGADRCRLLKMQRTTCCPMPALWLGAAAQHGLAQLTGKAPVLRRVALCREAQQ